MRSNWIPDEHLKIIQGAADNNPEIAQQLIDGNIRFQIARYDTIRPVAISIVALIAVGMIVYGVVTEPNRSAFLYAFGSVVGAVGAAWGIVAKALRSKEKQDRKLGARNRELERAVDPTLESSRLTGDDR